MTSWRKELEGFNDKIVDCTLLWVEMDEPFENGYGTPKAKPFVAWSKDWVYLSTCSDGYCSVARVPRNPVEGYHPFL